MLADSALRDLLHRRPRAPPLPAAHAPIASGWSNSCRVGQLPPTGSTCPFHGARILRVSQRPAQELARERDIYFVKSVHNEGTSKSALFSTSKVILEIQNALPGSARLKVTVPIFSMRNHNRIT